MFMGIVRGYACICVRVCVRACVQLNGCTYKHYLSYHDRPLLLPPLPHPHCREQYRYATMEAAIRDDKVSQ